jgi:hypothetical protein
LILDPKLHQVVMQRPQAGTCRDRLTKWHNAEIAPVCPLIAAPISAGRASPVTPVIVPDIL